MTFINYYDLLGVDPKASEDEIKRAYKKKARKLHPDISEDLNANEKMQQLNEAYAILSDQDKRREFDKILEQELARKRQEAEAQEQARKHQEAEEQRRQQQQLYDFFVKRCWQGSLFSSANTNRGDSVGINLGISLEEAFWGLPNYQQIPDIYLQCPECQGKGYIKYDDWMLCNGCNNCLQRWKSLYIPPGDCYECNNKGYIANNPFTKTIICPQCQGKGCVCCHGIGRLVVQICNKCSSWGRVKGNKTIKINIPQGIDSGYEITIPGAGNCGISYCGTDRDMNIMGPSGDLLIKVNLQEHEFFKREGLDLHCDALVDFDTLVLGGYYEFSTLEKKKLKLKIKPGSNNDTVLRCKEKGMRFGNKRGDILVHLKVKVPQNLTKDQEKLLGMFYDSLRD